MSNILQYNAKICNIERPALSATTKTLSKILVNLVPEDCNQDDIYNSTHWTQHDLIQQDNLCAVQISQSDKTNEHSIDNNTWYKLSNWLKSPGPIRHRILSTSIISLVVFGFGVTNFFLSRVVVQECIESQCSRK